VVLHVVHSVNFWIVNSHYNWWFLSGAKTRGAKRGREDSSLEEKNEKEHKRSLSRSRSRERPQKKERRNRRLKDFKDCKFEVASGKTLLAWCTDTYGPAADMDDWSDEEKIDNIHLYIRADALSIVEPYLKDR